MVGEYTTDIQYYIQSLINDAMMIESSLNKKNIWLAYYYVKNINKGLQQQCNDIWNWVFWVLSPYHFLMNNITHHDQ